MNPLLQRPEGSVAPRKRVVKPKQDKPVDDDPYADVPRPSGGPIDSGPGIFYHGTTVGNAAKILKEGLTPQVEDRAQLSTQGYVYLTTSSWGASQWAKAQARRRGGKPALIRVDLPANLAKKVEEDAWEIGVDLKTDRRFKGSIPATHCSSVPLQGESNGRSWNYASHKTPPLADNNYVEETNGYVNMPEKIKGNSSSVPLELMMPEEFGIEPKTGSAITVRPMKGKDLGKYERNDKRLMEETMYLRYSYLKNEPHMVALDGDKVVGDLELQENPNNPDEFWFMHITTRVGYQGQGIASQLIKAAVEYVSQSGRHVLRISSFSDEGEQKVQPVLQRLQKLHPEVKI